MHPLSQLTAQQQPVRVVEVNHGHRVGLQVAREQEALGCEVAAEIAVIVQMVASEVGKDGGIEAQSRHPLLMESVGGDLHGKSFRSSRLSGLDGIPQIDRRRGGHGGVVVVARPAVDHGRKQRRSQSRLAEHGLGQKGGGGLAVGTGNGKALEILIRATVQLAQQLAGAGGRRSRHQAARKAGRAKTVGDDRHGTGSQGLVGKEVAVLAAAALGDEQRARTHLAGIGSHSRHLDVGHLAQHADATAEKEIGKLHAGPSSN